MVIAWEKGHRRVMFEVDSQTAVKALKDGGSRDGLNAPLIDQIKEVMGKQWSIQIDNIYGEGNCDADILANVGANLENGINPFPRMLDHVHVTMEIINAKILRALGPMASYDGRSNRKKLARNLGFKPSKRILLGLASSQVFFVDSHERSQTR
ncbi:unnamed protein product [Dovyalis caffra]|uniref:RNase H type-1 domain-containing protein n=1 Tax=Dovyalis caffra TaxID=77055 RepID=A0AAV1SUH4_9ROSI|nr:unnamed protein product [Dovyalis caffra]